MINDFIDNWSDLVSYVQWIGWGGGNFPTSSVNCNCEPISNEELERKIASAIEKHGFDGNAILTEIYGKRYQSQSDVEQIVQQKIAKLVNEAPEQFDTLKEIADWISTHGDVIVPTKVSELENDANFITLNEVDYYDDSELRALIEQKQDKGNYLTEHQDLSAYALKTDLHDAYDDTELRNLINAKQDKGDFLTEHQDLSGYALKDEIPSQYDDTTIKERLNSLESIDHSKFITEHQSLEGYAKTSDVAELSNKQLNDVNVLRSAFAELAGRLSLVEFTQKAVSDTTMVVASNVEEISAIPSEEKVNTNLVLSSEEVVESMSTKDDVFNSIAIVNTKNDATIYACATNNVVLDGMTINGDKDNTNGKINFSTPELVVKNTTIDAGAYNVFEGEQSTAEGARNTENVVIDNLIVSEPTLTHNVINVYTPTDNAEITIKNSFFNLDMTKTNVLRLSNYLNSKNVVITFDNVDWTYENVGYGSDDIAWGGLVLCQAAKGTADTALNGDYSNLSTWKIVVKNCRYNGVKVNAENCQYGNANQIGYFYSDSVKQSVDLGTIIPIVFE